jgi:hypothetical protein
MRLQNTITISFQSVMVFLSSQSEKFVSVLISLGMVYLIEFNIPKLSNTSIPYLTTQIGEKKK